MIEDKQESASELLTNYAVLRSIQKYFVLPLSFSRIDKTLEAKLRSSLRVTSANRMIPLKDLGESSDEDNVQHKVLGVSESCH